MVWPFERVTRKAGTRLVGCSPLRCEHATLGATLFRHLRLPWQRLDPILQESHRGRASVQECQDLQAGQAGLGWVVWLNHVNVGLSELTLVSYLLKSILPLGHPVYLNKHLQSCMKGLN